MKMTATHFTRHVIIWVLVITIAHAMWVGQATVTPARISMNARATRVKMVDDAQNLHANQVLSLTVRFVTQSSRADRQSIRIAAIVQLALQMDCVTRAGTTNLLHTQISTKPAARWILVGIATLI